VPRVWSQVLNFYKTFSVLHIIGQMSMDKVSRFERRACGRDPPRPAACGLRPAVHGACLRAGPSLFFYFCLRAGGILPALCSLPLTSRHCFRRTLQWVFRNLFLMLTIRNIFNFWVPASSTV